MLYIYLSFCVGAVAGILIVGLCRASKRSDLESKIYCLERDLETANALKSYAEHKHRPYPLKDAD